MKVTIEFNVENENDLMVAFVRHLQDGEAGSVKEDKEWWRKQIAHTEADNPDRKELALFIGLQAGFTGATGYVLEGWEKR